MYWTLTSLTTNKENAMRIIPNIAASHLKKHEYTAKMNDKNEDNTKRFP